MVVPIVRPAVATTSWLMDFPFPVASKSGTSTALEGCTRRIPDASYALAEQNKGAARIRTALL
eukprot:5227247-Heterocapsa_arctica.AAC.1